MRANFSEPLRSQTIAGHGWLGIAVFLAVLLTFSLCIAGDAKAASIEVQAPPANKTLRHSAFKFKFRVLGLSGPHKVICLVNGRLPDSKFNCDPAHGHADLRNGKQRIRLIAYTTNGPQEVVTRTFTVKINDRFWPQIQPLVGHAQIISGSSAPLKFLTKGASFWRCRVDGRRQYCGPRAGTEYKRWTIAEFQPPSLTPGWHRISFGAMDANHRWGIADRWVYVVRGVGPRIDVHSPVNAKTTDDSPVLVKFWVSQAPARVWCWVDGVRVRHCLGDDHAYRSGLNQTAPLPLKNGPHTVTLRALDMTGNVSTTVTRFNVADTTAPTVVFDEPQNGRTYTDIADWRLVVRHSPGVLECRLRPAAFAPCGAPTPTGAAWPDSAAWGGTHPQSNGAYVNDVRVTDPEGRQTTATSSFTIADHTPPSGYPIWPLTNEAPRVFPLLFSDYGERWRCALSIDGAPFKLCGQGTARYKAPDLMLESCGPHTYTIRLEDGVGNFQTIVRNINVVSSGCPVPASPPSSPAPTGPTGSSGPTGATGPTGAIGADSLSSTLIMLKRPVVRLYKNRRARIRIVGSLVGNCAGTTSISVQLRGKKKLRIVPRVRAASTGSRCTFSVKRRVPARRIAGLRSKVVVEFKSAAGTTRSSRGFRAPLR